MKRVGVLMLTTLAVTAVTAVTAVVCASSAPGAAGRSTALPGQLVLPDGLTVGVEFPRYLHVERRLEAIIDNQSDVDVTVIDIALRSPLFEPLHADIHDYTVAAQLRRDLQLGVGEAICPPMDGPSMVEMTVEIDGEQQNGLVEIDPAPIEAINDTECDQQFVLDTVDIELGPHFEVADGVITTAITMTRRTGDDRIALTAARGTLLYLLEPAEPAEPAAAAEPLATAEGDERSAAASITLRVIRCEPHAVAESKKSLQFSVWVTVGASPEYFVTIVPGDDLVVALEALVQECVAASTPGP